MIDDTGRLSFRGQDVQPVFSFEWRGRRFRCTLSEGRMEISGVVGQVPSSAGGADRREPAFALLRGLGASLPGSWGLRLLPDHRVEMQASEAMDWPATAAGVLQPVVRFLLVLSPYLDLLDESGL